VDFDTLDDQQVTVRERDEMTQDRLPIAKLADYLTERMS
jgi:glycyl-tRNA synthetase